MPYVMKFINITFGLYILNQNKNVGKENAIRFSDRIVVTIYRPFLLVNYGSEAPFFL